jgi:hypothetical protein
MVPSPTISRYRGPRGRLVARTPRQRKSGVLRRPPAARRGRYRAWWTPVDRRLGRSLLLHTVIAESSPRIVPSDADRRRDIELVGIGLGVWVLLMLLVVQWA